MLCMFTLYIILLTFVFSTSSQQSGGKGTPARSVEAWFKDEVEALSLTEEEDESQDDTRCVTCSVSNKHLTDHLQM